MRITKMKFRQNSCRLTAPLFTALALGFASAHLHAQVSLTTVVELAQKNSATVHLAQADVQKAASLLSQSKDAFIPSISFGSGLPAFPEIGFTGSLPTVWDGSMQSLVFSLPQIKYIQAARAGLQSSQLALKDAKEQVALDASTAYIEMDTVNSELEAVREQELNAARLVTIEGQRTDAGVDPQSALLQAKLTAAQLKLSRLHLETRTATLSKQLATLTGLPDGSIVPDHSSIPEVPAVSAKDTPILTPALDAAEAQANKLKDEYISTEHLLLGLMAEGGAALKKMFGDEKIPFIAINIPIPGGYWFNLVNKEIGTDTANVVVPAAKAKGWTAADTSVLIVQGSQYGAEVNDCVRYFYVTAAKNMPGMEQVEPSAITALTTTIGNSGIQVDGKATLENSYTAVKNALQTLPNDRHILLYSINDDSVLGAWRAITESKREANTLVAGLGDKLQRRGILPGGLGNGERLPQVEVEQRATLALVLTGHHLVVAIAVEPDQRREAS